MIRVLIVDDSALMRKKLSEMLMAEPDIEVIATARDGEDGVAKARELRPDVITMDINMPRLDGLSALQLILEDAICPVIMVSSLTQEGALATFEAMELGAFDYVAKPGGTISMNIAQTQRELGDKIRAATKRRARKAKRHDSIRTGRVHGFRSPEAEQDRELLQAGADDMDLRWAVAIGISTGGPRTILEVVPELPPDLGVPVFMVQHMPPAFTASFAARLAQVSQMPVVEARAGDAVRQNVVYLAKGGQHMLLRKASTGKISLRLSTIPETLFMPSVNVMMDSVLQVFGAGTLGVLMTGMGNDGADAMCRIRKAGGYGIAESEETAVVWGMPKEAIQRGGADIVLPSHQIAEEIVHKVRQWQARRE